MLNHARGARLERAYDTLARGSEFLGKSLRARAEAGQEGLTGAGGAKVVGNGLRELDRFLNLLIDEATAAICPPSFDEVAFVRQHNVGNKIEIFYGLARVEVPEAERLRAIGRVRSCLHHCRGIVHDPVLWRDLSVAASDEPALPQDTLADRLYVSFEELDRICAFYAMTGDAVFAVSRAISPVP